MCSNPPHTQLQISSAAPVCVDIAPPGQPLGAKTAGHPSYLPGVCQAMGGQPSGIATGTQPVTFCCRP
jgi:hypothetical protein